jgi:nitroreductase
VAPTDLLLSRRSTPSRLLGPPGPDEATLLELLGAAVHVPDHGKLAPWRFVLVEGDARARLGEVLAERHRATVTEASQTSLEKERQRFLHAPTVIVAVGRIDPGHRIPEQEQLLSGGCACFSLLLAAHAHGFGAQWLT